MSADVVVLVSSFCIPNVVVVELEILLLRLDDDDDVTRNTLHGKEFSPGSEHFSQKYPPKTVTRIEQRIIMNPHKASP